MTARLEGGRATGAAQRPIQPIQLSPRILAPGGMRSDESEKDSAVARSTVITLQFVPVLAAVAIIATFTWQRTGSYRAGGLITGLLVTLYTVAGTATQV